MLLTFLFVKPPRWPSGKGVRLESGRSGLQFPLAVWGFYWVKSYQCRKIWHTSGYPTRRLAL